MKFIKDLLGIEEFDNEPIEIGNVFKNNCWPFYIWPKVDRYRITYHELEWSHKYQLEAFFNGEWVEAKQYDHGYDDWGQLHAGRWKILGESCSWDKKGLQKLVNKITGKQNPKKVLGEIG